MTESDVDPAITGFDNIPIVLNNLILSLLSSTALDQDVSRSQGRDSIFTDITEPNVLQSASTLAVDTLELVFANNDIGDGSTVLQDEDSGFRSGVVVGVACTSTIELLVTEIDGAADGGWLGERNDAARAGWDVEGLGRGQRGENAGNNCCSELHVDW